MAFPSVDKLSSSHCESWSWVASRHRGEGPGPLVTCRFHPYR